MCLSHILEVGLMGYGNGLNIVVEKEVSILSVISKFICSMDGGGFSRMGRVRVE